MEEEKIEEVPLINKPVSKDGNGPQNFYSQNKDKKKESQVN